MKRLGLVNGAHSGVGADLPDGIASTRADDLGRALQGAVRRQVELHLDVVQVPEPFHIATLVPDTVQQSADGGGGIGGRRIGRPLIQAGDLGQLQLLRAFGARTALGGGFGGLFFEA